MKAPMLCLLAMPVCLLLSCSGEKKLPEEEKIHIIVQHEKSRDEDGPGAESSSRPRSGTHGARSEPVLSPREQAQAGVSDTDDQSDRAPDDDIIKIPGARGMIRNMIRDDDQLKELVTQGNVLPLAEYLLDHHEPELDKIAQKSQIKNKRRIAFILSRMMTQSHRARREQHEE